ncbi:MAG: NAD+ synthase [Chloroflexi bacterium]|nr:NAD+ synthase [Chloroflexota bacterium]
MRIALAQTNPIVGDLTGNVARCLAAIRAAEGADLVVLPELALPGYPPRDILYDETFVQACHDAAADLAERARSGPPVLLGTVLPAPIRPPDHPGLYNAAVLLHEGAITLAAAKRLLPAYDVFHEPRWFLPGPTPDPLTIAGRRIGVIICEDLWDEGYQVHPPADQIAAGADLLVCLSASPFRHDVMEHRLRHARRQGCPLVYVNSVGGNDELIFDGRSFAIDEKGDLLASLPAFTPHTRTVNLDADPSPATDPPDPLGLLFGALTLGIRDFVEKNGLAHAFLGVSGGIDSAVTAVLATEALGAERVTAVAIPSRYTDPRSTESAQALAEALGIDYRVVELEPMHTAVEAALGITEGIAAENIQARLRALILMSFTNREGGMLLNTSNKTELALGYATLYGDMAGALCPLADLTKLQVLDLARWINAARGEVIPAFTLERAPTAELRADQVDPFDYAEAAPALEALIRANQSSGALRRSEHKRWQMGVILKVSDKAFGTGRMMPITRR